MDETGHVVPMPASRRTRSGIVAAAIALFGATACGHGAGVARKVSSPDPAPSSLVTVEATVSSSPGPAPAGASTERTATVQSGPLRLVGIGDSTLISSVDHGAGVLDDYAELITAATGRPVEVTELGDGANDSEELLHRVRTSKEYRAAVSGADVLVIVVGANDSDPRGEYPAGTCAPSTSHAECLSAYAPGFVDNYGAILDEVEALRVGRPTAFRAVSPDYNYFIGHPEPPSDTFALGFFAQVVEAQTDAVCTIAASHSIPCADDYHVFNGPDGRADATDLLADDHDHPGDAGTRVIAEVLMALGLAEVR